MMRRAGFLPASGVWLTVYVVCALFVTSFIFFEVLDVDGSDFPTHPAKMAVLFEVLDVDGSDFERAPSRLAIKLAEESHEECKRPALGPGGPSLVPLLDARAAEPPPASSTIERHGSPRVPPPVRTSHAALPRALRSDVPPSA